MLIVTMLQDWQGPPDARGDIKAYPRGWTGEMDDDAAGYCLARGFASTRYDLSAALAAGIGVLREIIAHLEVERINPTYRAVYDAVARLAEMQANVVPQVVQIPNARPDQLTVGPIGVATDAHKAPDVLFSADAGAAAQAAATGSATRVTRRRRAD